MVRGEGRRGLVPTAPAGEDQMLEPDWVGLLQHGVVARAAESIAVGRRRSPGGRRRRRPNRWQPRGASRPGSGGALATLGLARLALQIDGHRVAVGIAHQRGGVGDDIGHGAARAGVRVAAGAQDIRRCRRCSSAPRPVRSLPVRSGATQLSRVPPCKSALGFVCAERVLGRVTAAAVAEAIDEIGAAIPFR